MEPIHLARTLALVNTALDGLVVGLGQRTYDLPGRGRRLAAQCGVAVAAGAVMAAADAVWDAATRDRTAPIDPDVIPAHESSLAIGHLVLSTACLPVWWFGRGLPERMRRGGNPRPNRTLALPLGLAYAAGAAPLWWAHARRRTDALTP